MKSILDPSFQYVPSHDTDIRKTFERIKREREKVQAHAFSRPSAEHRPKPEAIPLHVQSDEKERNGLGKLRSVRSGPCHSTGKT